MPTEPAQPTQTPSKGQIFLRRLTSTVALWTVVLGAMFSGREWLSNTVFLVILLLLTTVGLVEFYALVGKRGLACFPQFGVAAGVTLILATFLHLKGWLGIHDSPARVNDFESSLLIFFVLGLCVRQFLAKDNPHGLQAIATTLLGLMYVAWLLNFIQKVFFFPKVDGRYYLLYFLLVTKFSDTGAYVVGSLMGRHKMIPRISPGKTWEGFAGAIAVSTGASVLFARWAGDRLAGMDWVHAVVLGVALSVAAVVGDLIESLFKREAGVKDSGRFFPGIGGILDLLDSLMFNAPLMYVYLRHVLTHP